METGSVKQQTVFKYSPAGSKPEADWLATEEPLEIKLEYGPVNWRMQKNLSVTMRTPGADEDLVSGFLFTEGLIRRGADIQSIEHIDDIGNSVLVRLHPSLQFDMGKLDRHFYTSSSCGVCGKSSIDAVKTAVPCPLPDQQAWSVAPELIYTLPDLLRAAQDNFGMTGGLHASALFDQNGALITLREDVGRHNALDKLIGACLKNEQIPLDQHILMLSGRASFELLQKAAMAGIRLVCAVGAPSSLAVETAEAFGIALIGFLRDNRFNLYAQPAFIRNSI